MVSGRMLRIRSHRGKYAGGVLESVADGIQENTHANSIPLLFPFGYLFYYCFAGTFSGSSRGIIETDVSMSSRSVKCTSASKQKIHCISRKMGV